MSKTVITEDWSSATVIDEEELQEYVFPTHDDKDGKIEVRNYCIEVGGDTIDTEAFIQFLKEKFLYYVFPEEELEEHGKLAYNEAWHRVGFDDKHDSDGLYGELLLFVFVDAVLNMPMISHKLLLKSNPNDEEKGSDGIYFGEYEGAESLGLGEAKFYTDKKGGIRNSLESTSRFHGEDGDETRRHELSIAARGLFAGTNLDKELDSSELEDLAERLTAPSRDYQIIHPIFIGYEQDEFVDIQAEPRNENGLREELKQLVSEEEEILEYIRKRVSDKHEELRTQYLIFIFLPVEKSEEFRERVKDAIYPPTRG